MAVNLDPVTLEVIRNALPAISNEMAADLQRTSYNMMIYEVRDFCTALVNADGELLCQNVGGVSHFVADLGIIITDGVKKYGREGFAPGDVEGGLSYDEMKSRIMGELKKVFRPELLNRIDEVIVFHKLAKEEIAVIVDLMMRRLREQIESDAPAADRIAVAGGNRYATGIP